jgi:hypothetical protein
MKKEYMKPELVEYEELRNLTAGTNQLTGEPATPSIINLSLPCNIGNITFQALKTAILRHGQLFLAPEKLISFFAPKYCDKIIIEKIIDFYQQWKYSTYSN